MGLYFVKSFEEDHSTKTLVGKEKRTLQTFAEIVASSVIKPNTKSFGQKKRLSTTILSDNYTKPYRPQGIIFQTDAEPDYVLPFDLVLLSNAENIVVHYYRIKNNLHIYYNHKLIDGYEEFIYKNIEAMLEKFSSPEHAWKTLNDFRAKHGYKPLPHSKYRLAEYNEEVFLGPVKIRPIAIFGYRAETRLLAKKHNLPHYVSAKDFYERVQRSNSQGE